MEENKILEEKAEIAADNVNVIRYSFNKVIDIFRNSKEPEKSLLGVIILLKTRELNDEMDKYTQIIKERIQSGAEYHA